MITALCCAYNAAGCMSTSVFSLRSYAISLLKAYYSFFKFLFPSLKDIWIHSPALAHVTACRFLGTNPQQVGRLFMQKLTLPGLRFRDNRGFSENDWASIPQNPSVRISQNSHQAVPWHRRLTNGSLTFEFWYGGQLVGLRAKTLDNHWAPKTIFVYSLARARITACRWIRGKSPTRGKTFYAKIYPPRFAVPEQSGFLRKRLGLLCAKSVNANFAKFAPSTTPT